MYLKFESIVEDGQEESIGQILQQYGILGGRGISSRGEKFQIISGYTNFKQSSPSSQVYVGDDVDKFQNNGIDLLREYYTIDDLRFILETLDLDFERDVLNYSYDWVQDYINSNVTIS